MKRYHVRLEFSNAITNDINAITENDAIIAVFRHCKESFANLGIQFKDLEVKCHELTWRDNEDYAGIIAYYGEPDYEHNGSPIWINKDMAKGVILDNGAVVAFGVDHDNKIFDVWHDGHFVDYGEDYYQAYFNHVSEKVLLNE